MARPKEPDMNEIWDTAVVAPIAEVGRIALTFLPSLLFLVIILTAGFVTAWAVGHLVERPRRRAS